MAGRCARPSLLAVHTLPDKSKRLRAILRPTSSFARPAKAVPNLANLRYPQQSMIALKTTFTDLELSDDGKLLLQEAMLELETDEQGKAKKIVKDRLLEIKRLETMLAKAKADLAELLERDQTEILMLEGN
jgi:hypothetical protein